MATDFTNGHVSKGRALWGVRENNKKKCVSVHMQDLLTAYMKTTTVQST